jgi:hypothetical protein
MEIVNLCAMTSKELDEHMSKIMKAYNNKWLSSHKQLYEREKKRYESFNDEQKKHFGRDNYPQFCETLIKATYEIMENLNEQQQINRRV